MANVKISELTELSKVADEDLLVVVDSSENETKKIKVENFGAGGVDIPISDIEPENPKENDFWLDTADSNNLKFYKDSEWNSSNGKITGDTLPIGSEVDYDGTTVPAGWEEVSGLVKSVTYTATTNSYGNASSSISAKGKIPIFAVTTDLGVMKYCFPYISNSTGNFGANVSDIQSHTVVANTSVTVTIYYIESDTSLW